MRAGVLLFPSSSLSRRLFELFTETLVVTPIEKLPELVREAITAVTIIRMIYTPAVME